MVVFPVLRMLNVKDYQLYINKNNNGVEHDFPGGVHLIVGINGLGKTTLLNAIFRLIVGPKDLQKEGDKTLGSSKGGVIDWKKKKFFSSRVNDYAVDATIEGVISFGNRNIKIKRKLSNLEVISLEVDDISTDASQSNYEEIIKELSGIKSYSDFFSVVKFLIFFLEDRSDIIWDPKSQFEMFRILFFEPQESLSAADLRDTARSEDSKYRNLHASVYNLKKELQRISSEDSDLNKKEYAAASARMQGLQEEIEGLEDDISNFEGRYAKIKLDIAKTIRSFDEFKFGIAEAQHFLASKYFPSMNETVSLLLTNLSSNGGCFVCGSKNEEISEKFNKAILRNCCPMCESHPESQEKSCNSSLESEDYELQIDELKRKSEIAMRDLTSQKEELTHVSFELDKLRELLVRNTDERVRLQVKIRKIEELFPELLKDTEELNSQINSMQSLINRHDEARREATRSFNVIVSSQKNNLDSSLSKIKKKFEFYCKHLLVEMVSLEKTYYEGALGQGGEEKVKLPYFKVSMTSGVHTESPASRESNEQVSESQREFIDLAFRLALFDVVSERQESPVMIVMETPEASLDTLFMREISNLFRRFSSNCDGKNVFIASTNLNQSEMISSLLGINPKKEIINHTKKDKMLDKPGVTEVIDVIPAVPENKREDSIINLLKLAAKNAALRSYSEYYDTVYEKSVYPERSGNI